MPLYFRCRSRTQGRWWQDRNSTYFLALSLLASACSGSPLSRGPGVPMHTGSEPGPGRLWVFAQGGRLTSYLQDVVVPAHSLLPQPSCFLAGGV